MFTKIYVGTTPEKRNDILARVKEEKGPFLLFGTIKGLGVGVNLVEFTSVLNFLSIVILQCILLDLQWNPHVESQAADRIYRIEQTKPVTIHRLVTNTPVNKMQTKLQEVTTVFLTLISKNKKAAAAKILDVDDDTLLYPSEVNRLIALEKEQIKQHGTIAKRFAYELSELESHYVD